MEIWLALFGLLTIVISIFLILLILVQRGRGGGLAGALGGMGGQSAFGSKAGDVFTRITVVTATIWILMSTLMIAFFNRPPREIPETSPGSAMTSGDAAESGTSSDGEAPEEFGATNSGDDQKQNPTDGDAAKSGGVEQDQTTNRDPQETAGGGGGDR